MSTKNKGTRYGVPLLRTQTACPCARMISATCATHSPADGVLRRLHHYAEHRLCAGFPHQNAAGVAQLRGHVIHSLLHVGVVLGGCLVVHPDVLQHLGIDGAGPRSSLLRGFFRASITSISFRLVRMPSPVEAYLEKMMWPALLAAQARSRSGSYTRRRTYRPPRSWRSRCPARSKARYRPKLDMMVVTTVLWGSSPRSFMWRPQMYRIWSPVMIVALFVHRTGSDRRRRRRQSPRPGLSPPRSAAGPRYGWSPRRC